MRTLSRLGAGLTTDVIILISVVGALFVIAFTISTIKYFKKRKKRMEEADREVEDVTVKHGVRYTDDETIVDKLGDMNVTFNKGDIVLKQNVTYHAGKKLDFLPGKYTILATRDSEEEFNVRIGTYVKTYKHGQVVVIAEGEEVTPTSTDIILR